MNKKGFTLIELLAVIVILAVIALIATPVIMNAISNAKQGAWKDAAYGIVKATENVYAKNFSEVTDQADTFFLYESGVMKSYPTGKTIDYKGSVPQDGGIVLHSDGSITLAIHDGSNCAVKTKSASTVTVSTTDKATCISNIYYKQASAPFTNAVTNATFATTTGWSNDGGTVSVSNGILTSKVTNSGASGGNAYTSTGLRTIGHKYYVKISVKSLSDNITSFAYGMPYGDSINSPIKDLWYTASSVLTAANNYQYTVIYHNYASLAQAAGQMMQIKDPITIFLTTTYGVGNEPTKEQMDNNLNKVWIDSATNTPKRFTAGGWINF